MTMIKQHVIDKVLDACNIVEVVSDYVTLKKKGVRYFACCPFHQEKTPSFAVFPETGTFKCFGCDEQGNSVGFLMKMENLTYPEAIRKLAARYHIEVEESMPTAQEEAEHRQREAMWIANDHLAKCYHGQLQKNKAARDYAYGRWGKEYCELRGIGYCPKDAKLVDSVHISNEIADQLHLKNRGGYDFFSGRITIPIRDRQQRVIGFTARAFDSEDVAKYMNSKDSLIYSKSKSIFGVDTAWRKMAQTGICYVVEGAPDCMRLQSIGVENSVAPLGTAWTEEHFTQLKRVVSHLCFLPDADPPKKGERFGPGTKAVMKSGEDAMRFGFSVSVKQIPVGEMKQDPDTYCKDRVVFDCLEEQDFILWMADNLFEPGMTTEQQGKVIKQVAGLMVLIDDETTIEMYVSQLVRHAAGKRMWMKAVEKQRNEQAEAEARAKAEKESDLFKQFGFNVEKDKYYYSISDKGGIYEWSNFIMRPLFHIKDNSNAKRIYMLKNEFGLEELVELKQEDLVSLQKFMVRIEGLGNFIWKATQRELNKLKSYLYEKTETAEEIRQLGWQRHGFYAFGNGIFFEGKFIKVDDYGIVRLPRGNYYLPANSKIYRDDTKLFQFERRFVHQGLSTIALRDFTEQIFKVFGNNGRIGFMFLLATLNRDIVTRVTRSFPILNLFGPKGSGKSELGHTLMSFFIIENVPPNIQNSTLPALNDTVAAVANALVHIDEFKNSLDINKNEFLKGMWDGTGRTRMNMDLDKKKETTSVDAGVILSGQEMPTADIALFSRLIFLSFSKSEFTEEEKENYQLLKQMRVQGMSHLTLEILSHRKNVETSFPSFYQLTLSDVNERLKDLSIEDRILLNWVAPLAVLRCLENVLDVSLSYKDMLNVCVEGIRFQNAQCKQNNELANFWKVVMYLVGEGNLIDGGDYRIEYIRRLKTDIANVDWTEARPVLYIQKSRLFMLYKKNGKAVGDTVLPEGSLLYYLEHSRAYLGYKKGVRFKVYHNGVLQYKNNGKDGNTPESKVFLSYCFDYRMLEEDFGINLEIATDADGDTAHKEDYDATHPQQQEIGF